MLTDNGADAGAPVYQAVARHQPDPPTDVIPPRASAVVSPDDTSEQSQRDRHIQFIAEKGCMAWQTATDYGRRALAATTVGRDKAIIGPKLRARSLLTQQGEAAMAVEVLNRMIQIAKPTLCVSRSPASARWGHRCLHRLRATMPATFRPVVEPGRSWALMRRHLLGFLQIPAIG